MLLQEVSKTWQVTSMQHIGFI